jgi:hypothetical protein
MSIELIIPETASDRPHRSHQLLFRRLLRLKNLQAIDHNHKLIKCNNKRYSILVGLDEFGLDPFEAQELVGALLADFHLEVFAFLCVLLLHVLFVYLFGILLFGRQIINSLVLVYYYFCTV